MVIRGLAKFKRVILNRLDEEKKSKTSMRKVKQSYSKRMDKPTPYNCDWPVKCVEKKNLPPLETGKVVL